MKVLLPIILLAGFSAVAAAQDAPQAKPSAEAGIGVGAGSANEIEDRYCLHETGSRLITKRAHAKDDAAKDDAAKGGDEKAECVNAAGRSYSGEELRRTGARTTAEAILLLDPAFH